MWRTGRRMISWVSKLCSYEKKAQPRRPAEAGLFFQFLEFKFEKASICERNMYHFLTIIALNWDISWLGITVYKRTISQFWQKVFDICKEVLYNKKALSVELLSCNFLNNRSWRKAFHSNLVCTWGLCMNYNLLQKLAAQTECREGLF